MPHMLSATALQANVIHCYPATYFGEREISSCGLFNVGAIVSSIVLCTL